MVRRRMTVVSLPAVMLDVVHDMSALQHTSISDEKSHFGRHMTTRISDCGNKNYTASYHSGTPPSFAFASMNLNRKSLLFTGSFFPPPASSRSCKCHHQVCPSRLEARQYRILLQHHIKPGHLSNLNFL